MPDIEIASYLLEHAATRPRDMTIGRASYEPGGRWSKHVSAIAGASLCEVEHVRVVISGRAMAAMKDGTGHGGPAHA
jgi:hypothetical protein